MAEFYILVVYLSDIWGTNCTSLFSWIFFYFWEERVRPQTQKHSLFMIYQETSTIWSPWLTKWRGSKAHCTEKDEFQITTANARRLGGQIRSQRHKTNRRKDLKYYIIIYSFIMNNLPPYKESNVLQSSLQRIQCTTIQPMGQWRWSIVNVNRCRCWKNLMQQTAGFI